MVTGADLTAAMDVLAADTWRRLEHGTPRGLAPAEESITDHVLFELNQQFPAICVYKPSKKEEARSGADWEWWVGSPERGWLCLRVQAKRIYGKNYRELSHTPKGSTSRQIDLLIKGCDRPGYLPYHVFYNGWEGRRFGNTPTPADTEQLERNLRYFPHQSWQPFLIQNPCNRMGLEVVQLGSRSPRWWGCAALSSYHVRQLMQHSRQRHYAPRYLRHAMPWSMLFSDTAETRIRDHVSSELTDSVDVLHWRLLADSSIHQDTQFGPSPPSADYSLLQHQRVEDLPDYVWAVLELRDVEPEALNRHLAEQVPADYLVLTDLSRFDRSASSVPFRF
ncbi:DUF6615 family protein [Nocardia salmonicida]|uniref:DUF6615 family protein n=1 Tax=Nocardia salmonicida TaxID=53431 RepID=UPI003CF89C61